MAKSSNQKTRLLLVREILLRETDEDHRLTVPELVERLAARGVEVERKSLYDDMEALRAAGEDVQLQRGHNGGYCIGERLFELPELMVLVDAVKSSRFITAQKSGKLIKKLESLTSAPQARQLQRQVVVNGRVKTMNESIYYAVDTIHTGISQQQKIRFRYMTWAVDPTAPGGFSSREKHGGRPYVVSPWALVWMEENYYLIAFEEVSQAIRHFRVDKMNQLRVLNQPRDGQKQFENFDLARYTQSLFGMFSGEVQEVCVELENSLVGVLVDRFGRGLVLHPARRPGWFSVRLQVVPGPTFYGWVMSFGARAQVLSPQPVRAELRRYAQALSRLYETEEPAPVPEQP